MNKLQLNLDDLSVDSFKTDSPRSPGGTVNGQAELPGDDVIPSLDVICYTGGGCDTISPDQCTMVSELYTACCETMEPVEMCNYESNVVCVVDPGTDIDYA